MLFKFHCYIFIGVRIFKELPGSVASGTPCINLYVYCTLSLTTTFKSFQKIPYRPELREIFCAMLIFFNTLKTGEADLLFYITTVQDG